MIMYERITIVLVGVFALTVAYAMADVQAAAILSIAGMIVGALVRYGMEAGDLLARERRQAARRAARS